MIKKLKIISSLPLALIVCATFYSVSQFAMIKFEGFFFKSVYYILKDVLPVLFSGFILTFTFCFLGETNNKNYGWFINTITVIYSIIMMTLLLSFLDYGEPSTYFKKPLISFTKHSYHYFYLFIGSIFGIIFIHKSWHLTQIPFDEEEDEFLQRDEVSFVKGLIVNKKWRKLNYYYNRYYDEDLTQEVILKLNIKEILQRNL